MKTNIFHRLAIIAVLLLTVAAVATPADAVTIPDQFIARLYTEALGRIPDQSGWTGQVNFYKSSGCSLSTLKTEALFVFTSPEFMARPYDNESRLLALFRGTLDREPDAATFNSYLTQLNGGTAWSTVVTSMLDSTAFSNLWQTHCALILTGYGWGVQSVLNLTPGSGGDFGGGTGAQLQALLNAAKPNGTVRLKQKSVTRLTQRLTIPSGVTLTTYGVTDRRFYAKMGRLVRDSAFATEMIKLEPGAKMTYVWVDGTRNYSLNFTSDAINVRMYGYTSGSGYAASLVQGCRISNSRGWSTLNSVGWNYTCNGHTIRDNLVTSYSSEHIGRFTDGLSIGCENALVENNEIVDATDVPIVVFRADSATQQSIVRNNLILNAGNSAYGGLVIDPLYGSGLSYDFAGTSITGNTMWTGSRVHWDIALSVGTKAWFGSSADAAYGPSVTNNTTGSVRSNVDIGIAISKAYNVTVLNNNLLVTHVNSDPNCPDIDVIAAVSAGDASGVIQTFTDQAVPHCIGH